MAFKAVQPDPAAVDEEALVERKDVGSFSRQNNLPEESFPSCRRSGATAA
jgi:hypothetical protein